MWRLKLTGWFVLATIVVSAICTVGAIVIERATHWNPRDIAFFWGNLQGAFGMMLMLRFLRRWNELEALE